MNLKLNFELPSILAAIAWLAHLMTGPTIWPLQVFYGFVIVTLVGLLWVSAANAR